ncbi:MAG: hypothetical protein JWM89_1837 [Acidimicrobiales bacterium]|nr:hypothetical protein [Acidimicrobiales bacterium]
MPDPSIETIPNTPAPPVRLHGLTLLVAPTAHPVAYTNHSVGGAQIHVGDHFDPQFVLAADSAGELLQFLDRARNALLAAAPDSDPDPGPDERLLRAREILVEDALEHLGVPVMGEVRELDEISKGDVRATRRATRSAVDLLEGVLSEYGPLPAVSPLTAVG